MTHEPDPLQASTDERPNESKPAVRPSGADPQLTLPFAAMAEALRANADALRRIDSSRRVWDTRRRTLETRTTSKRCEGASTPCLAGARAGGCSTSR